MEIPPGLRKLRYFQILLVLTVWLYVLGYILSQLYGFTLLKSVIAPFIEHPMVIFDIAGILSLAALAVISWRYFLIFRLVALLKPQQLIQTE